MVKDPMVGVKMVCMGTRGRKKRRGLGKGIVGHSVEPTGWRLITNYQELVMWVKRRNYLVIA